ncbi:putative transcriptional regulator [Cellulomonas iranensis]|uniref:Transcriptional regulator n=1 Tax=Cellulomonas iranensis TaxID=76862 RepID=A0ABU0GPD6_9CELL|nr:putative transcriptional regulator [Cellulomonas iranensis]
MTDTHVVRDDAAGDTADGGFIAPVAMEDDPAELFAGDTGTLDADVRRVLVRLLQRRFLLAERHRAQWRTLLENQQVIESRLHDLFVHLVVDHERGIAYKRQVRSAELDVPVLLRDEPYTRAETLVLVHLRTVFQRERGAGETSARVDVEELEATALTYFDPDDTNVAAHQREIRTAIARLVKDGVVDEESEGRYRVTPLVEVVLSNERLTELREWLRARDDAGDAAPDDDATDEPTDVEPDDEPDDDADPADGRTAPDDEDDEDGPGPGAITLDDAVLDDGVRDDVVDGGPDDDAAGDEAHDDATSAGADAPTEPVRLREDEDEDEDEETAP